MHREVRIKVANAGMWFNLVTEPILHPVHLGIEIVVGPVRNEIHSVQIDKSEDSEDISIVEIITSKRADLPRVQPPGVEARVPSKSQAYEAECLRIGAGAAAERRGDVAGTGEAEERDGQVANRGHHLGASTGADAGAVLIEGYIPYPMEAILDRPMTAAQGE